jgi:hypothetical protein
MNYFRPHIYVANFPHIIRGSGDLTLIHIEVSGWGKLKVIAHKKEAIPFTKWVWGKSESFELDVPKEQQMTILFWNIFGKNQINFQSPGNNITFSFIKPESSIESKIPKPKLINFRLRNIFMLKSELIKNFSSKISIPIIDLVHTKILLQRSLRQQHSSTYRFKAPPLKAKINFQDIKYSPPINKPDEKRITQ